MSLASREVRLDLDQLYLGRDLCARRRRELAKRLKKTSYAGKPGMKDAVVRELKLATELECVFDHNHRAAVRGWIERNMPDVASATKSSEVPPGGDSA